MFTGEDILKATDGKLISTSPNQIIENISTDSRTISQGELFVALEGKNFDGHNFIGECLLKGAVGVIVREGRHFAFSDLSTKSASAPFFIEVPDTLKALGDIAHFHRMRFDIPIIGITGSNGKTTTKDMTAQILSTKYKVLKNQGTFNNLIGVPQTLLKLNSGHEAVVLEMGTSHLGEIGRLAEIVKPNIGVITNIGPSHLEFLKDIETVAKAKVELFEGFTPEDAAIWNADDGMLSALYQTLRCKKKTFGASPACDYCATDIEYLENGWRFALNQNKLIKIKLLGRHNVYNALAAIAAGDTLGIEYEDIFFSLLNFSPPLMRMQILEIGGITVINDSYNSNPKSMESAIHVLSNFKSGGRRILVSGDMLELGEVSRYFHHQAGLDVAGANIDMFIGVGPLSKETAVAAIRAGMNSDAVWFCNDAAEAGGILLKILHSGDVVLIKGSRAMQMENICSTIYSIH